MDQWPRSVIWWQVYPLGFSAPEKAALPAGCAGPRRRRSWRRGSTTSSIWVATACCSARCSPPRRTATTPTTTSGSTRASADDYDSAADRRLPRSRACGCCSTASSTTSGAASPPSSAWLPPGVAGRWAGWFHIDWDADRPRRLPTTRSFEGHDASSSPLPRHPAGRRLCRQVMEHWLGRGVDGWRLDAAYAVPPGSGGRPRRVRARCPGGVVRRRGHPRRLRDGSSRSGWTP